MCPGKRPDDPPSLVWYGSYVVENRRRNVGPGVKGAGLGCEGRVVCRQ